MLTWLNGDSDRPPFLLKLRSSKTFIIITVTTAVFTDIFVYALIVPIVPFALTTRAGIDPDDVQTWISILLAVYGAALLVTSPFVGWLADRSSSRRVPLLLGLLALGGSTVLLTVGSSIGMLVAGRLLQGASASVVWIVGLALLVDTVGALEAGQAMGYVGISMSLAILVAPLLGGIVFAKAGYYAVFSMAFGLIAFDILLRFVMIEKKVALRWIQAEAPPTEAEKTAADTNQQLSQDIEAAQVPTQETSAAEVAKDEETPTSPVTSPTRPWTSRLPPVLRLCSSRRILSALFCTLIQSTLLTSFDATLPLFVKNTFGWDSIGAGLIFLPLVVVTFVGPVIGWWSDKYGPRWPATIGFIICAPFLILLRLVDHNSMQQKVLLCALLALVGIALTLILSPILAEITYAVAEKAERYPSGHFGKYGAYAQAYSLINMSWAAGCFLGPLLAGLVNQSQGWAVAYLILGCLSLFTAIPAVIFTGGSIFKNKSGPNSMT